MVYPSKFFRMGSTKSRALPANSDRGESHNGKKRGIEDSNTSITDFQKVGAASCGNLWHFLLISSVVCTGGRRQRGEDELGGLVKLSATCPALF